MSNQPEVTASQFFYYLRKDNSDSAYAFETNEGITVPFFSSQELAKKFLELSRVRSHGVAIILPTQMEGFTNACKRGKAKFLQLDPQPEILKNVRAKNINLT